MSRAIATALLVALTIAAIAAPVVAWPRDDTPAAPDAVIVLGGAGAERTDLGQTLASEHAATLVLSSSAQYFGERAGLHCGQEVLCLDPEPETTRGEARAVAALVEANGWHRVVVATSRHHTSRARVLFRQCLGDRVSVVGARRSDGSWWPGTRGAGRELVGMVAAVTVQRAC